MKPAAQGARGDSAKALVSHRVTDSPTMLEAEASPAEPAQADAAAPNGHVDGSATASAAQQQQPAADAALTDDSLQPDSRAAEGTSDSAFHSAPQTTTGREADADAVDGDAAAGGGSPSASSGAAGDLRTSRPSAQAADGFAAGTPSSHMSFATLDSSSAPGRWVTTPFCSAQMRLQPHASRSCPWWCR